MEQGETLKKGSEGEDVVALQRMLNLLGFRDENGCQLKEDGIFGNHTLAAVNKFKNIVLGGGNSGANYGVVGASTWKALGLKLESKSSNKPITNNNKNEKAKPWDYQGDINASYGTVNNKNGTGQSVSQSTSSGSWVDVFVGGLKSVDDSYYFGLIGNTNDKIRGLVGKDAYDWDYLKSTNSSFALGYKVGSYANAVYGVVNLASGLKQITTSGGTIIVNSAGEVVNVVSGTLEGVGKAIKGFVISAISTIDGASTPSGGE